MSRLPLEWLCVLQLYLSCAWWWWTSDHLPHMSFLRSNASEMQIATGFYMLVIGVRAGGERDGRGGRNITITRFLRATETAVSIINKKRQACVSDMEKSNNICHYFMSKFDIKYKELQSHLMFFFYKKILF